ncbi:IS1595 family transposase [Teredinibacter turnerae]|uniref:IS1595 family transposase n=1 Tax=Teredinibacter turnerae TaxID=2426 RepID=UPI0005F853F3|nr:IS1595 family transposase [Teredinibacter turnerae]
MSILSRPEFHDEEAAYAYVEKHVWKNGPTCPRCGGNDRITKMQGKSTRIGTYKCRACRKPFTVKIGTIFESSHVKMRLWLQAIYLMCASKKGVSSNQLHRTLGVTLKTAWFMSHRIREAMKNDTLSVFGSGGGLVEVDETYMGNTRGQGQGGHLSKKRKILTLVDRETQLMTDQAMHYRKIGESFAEHHRVNHSAGEYVNLQNRELHTNTVENYFSVFKRGMKGVYQHCAEKHLNRYLAEYDFRYNNRSALEINDKERADNLLSSVSGKRLTYQRSHREA